MTEIAERSCIQCGETGEQALLERCRICYRYFCGDCAHRARGVRFCSERCGLEYIYGDSDDDDVDPTEE